MIRAAIIAGGVVADIVLLNTLDELPGAIDAQGANRGDFYDEETGMFTSPVDIELLRQTMLAQVNAERDRREAGGFPYLGKLFDSDERSVLRINTMVQAASIAGDDFSITWTCADNTQITLDRAQILAMPVALGMHADALHRHANELKAAIREAVNPSDIDIAAGWPQPE